jgi:Icc-related predicted phosphoesterase
MADLIRLVLLSDTHGLHAGLTIPEGDVLIHAGDLTRHGSLDDVVEFNAYLGSLPHPHKIVIAGNHDWCFEREPAQAQKLLTNALYLQDSAVTIDGLKFYGSPWQPWFFDWAFNLPRGPELRKKWDLIPQDTAVLITHGPPIGILDQTTRNEQAGCEELLAAVHRLRPRLHIFGHIHEGYGAHSIEDMVFINASVVNEWYELVNAPIVYDLAPAC